MSLLCPAGCGYRQHAAHAGCPGWAAPHLRDRAVWIVAGREVWPAPDPATIQVRRRSTPRAVRFRQGRGYASTPAWAVLLPDGQWTAAQYIEAQALLAWHTWWGKLR